jgi:hypothetical protein
MQPAAFQECRRQLLAKVDKLREIRDDLAANDPLFVNGLPAEVRQKMLRLDRDSGRLRNPDLTVAFVGGFSAGKSSLVNAFLGRYLLPESTKVTTAVPTFVRSASESETAELHYLSEVEVEKLGELYRTEIASTFQMPALASAPMSTILEKVRPIASEGRGRRLVDQFQTFHEQRRRRSVDARGHVATTSIAEAQVKIRDETEAMFLDHVVLRVRGSQLPEDVVLVDLPGISVPNPRHRDITFRFVKEEAHALIFVLLATRLFDKDEIDIVEAVRSGESRIAEKTFWVLNRWDSLSGVQQQQTVADFEAKMREFAIPDGYQWFRTNALHGLLAHMMASDDPPQDAALQQHVSDYLGGLASRYGGSHQTALRESQLPALQGRVLSFLNHQLRQTTLRSAVDNARTNFCGPLTHHLRRAKDADDALLNGDLKHREKEASRRRVEELCAGRRAELERQLREMRVEVAEKRSGVLASRTNELLSSLDAKIAGGSETDAYAVYLEIISESELRRYPYHFEIEMRVVDKLNAMLKREFREIVRTQAVEVFDAYAKRVREALDRFGKDVNYSSGVMTPFEDVLSQAGAVFLNNVDGHVKSVVGEFDKLLIYLPPTLLWWGGNQVLDGLEKAARSGTEVINNPNEPIQKGNFVGKTEAIRKTLKDHYIRRVREEHTGIARNIPTLIINNMQEIEGRLVDVMQTKYRPALDVIVAQITEGEFGSQRTAVEARSRRLRDMVEQIEQLNHEMTSLLSDIPG